MTELEAEEKIVGLLKNIPCARWDGKIRFGNRGWCKNIYYIQALMLNLKYQMFWCITKRYLNS